MEKVFRNYNAIDVNAAVREHYRKMRERQTYEYVQGMHQKYLKFNSPWTYGMQ
jgi:inositol oxygenase